MSVGKLPVRVGALVFLLVVSACNSGGSSGTSAVPPLPTVGIEIVASTIPAPGASGVSIDAPVSVSFSLPMDPASFTPATLALYQGGNQIAGSVACDGDSATFTPTNKLASDTPMRAVLSAGVLTAAGESLDRDFSWNFSTIDVTPIQIVSHSPTLGQISVPILPQIVMNFSESVAPGSVIASNFQLLGPSGPVAGTLSLGTSQSVLFVPNAPLQEYSFYTAMISGITDIVGNAISPAYSWTFQTIDLGPPSVVSTIPVAANPMTIDVPVDVVVTAVFSEKMDPFSVTGSSIELREQQTGGLVPGTVALDPIDLVTLTFTPSAPLKDGRVYSAKVSGTVADLAGNPLGADFLWDFKTIPFQHGVFDLVESENAGNANSVETVMDPTTGEVFAVWRMQAYDKDGNGVKTNDPYVIFGSRFDPMTGLWDLPTQLNSNLNDDADDPAIAIDPVRKVVFAAWTQKYASFGLSPEIQSLAYSMSYYFGWADPTFDLQTISQYDSPNGGKVSVPRIEANPADGNFRIAWIHENSTGSGFIRSIATSTVDPALLFVGFSSWSAQATIDINLAGAVYKDLRLAIDASGQIPYVVFARTNPYSLYGSAKLGANWLTPVLLETNDLNTTGANLEGPSLVIDPFTKDAVVTWRQKQTAGGTAKFDALLQRFRLNGGTQSIVYPNCPNPTTTPCPTQLNTSPTNSVGIPTLAIDPAGTVLVAWSQNVPLPLGDGQTSVYSSFLNPGSSIPAFQLPAENVSTVACDNPQAAFAGPANGAFFLVFTQDASGKGGMWKSLYQSGTGWSSPALNLEPLSGLPVASEGGNALLSDGNGNGFCVWERKPTGTGAVTSLVSNRFP